MNVRSPTASISSARQAREAALQSLRSRKRDEILRQRRNREAAPASAAEDVPLSQSLPLLRGEHIVPVIRSICVHLEHSGYSDVALVLGCLGALYAHLHGPAEDTAEVLLLLINLSALDGVEEHLLAHDQSFIVSELITHPSHEVRVRAVWYLRNLISNGEVVCTHFRRMGLFDRLLASLQLFMADEELWNQVGTLLKTAVYVMNEPGPEQVDGVVVQLHEQRDGVTPVSFEQPCDDRCCIFDEVLPLLNVLYPRITSTPTVVSVFSSLASHTVSFGKLLAAIPTLVPRVVSLLCSRNKYQRQHAILFCVSLADGDYSQYVQRMVECDEFVPGLSYAVDHSTDEQLSDICFMLGNVIATDTDVSGRLYRGGVLRHIAERMEELRDMSRALEDYVWLYLDVLSTLNSTRDIVGVLQENAVMSFHLVSQVMDDGGDDYVKQVLQVIDRMVRSLANDEDLLAAFVSVLEETGILTKIYKLDYSDTHRALANRVAFAIDAAQSRCPDAS